MRSLPIVAPSPFWFLGITPRLPKPYHIHLARQLTQQRRELHHRKPAITQRIDLSWDCQNASTAWVGPDVAEFKRILEEKTEAAGEYMLGGLPLWLLIICGAVDDGGESHSDLASHIFPRNEAEEDQLDDVLRQTGFDFQAGPFAQVWLFSNFTKERRRLHPPPG
jgi:hypothetical protein